MGLQYKLKILDALKDKGINTNTLRKNKILSESTIQKLRNGNGIGWENLETICRLLDCQPADLIEFVKDDAEGVQ